MKYPPFAVSDKVVCVDESRPSSDWFSEVPRNGRVYVVRQLVPPENCADKNALGAVRLVGITSIDNDAYCFDPTRFRRLEEVQAENVQRRKEAA